MLSIDKITSTALVSFSFNQVVLPPSELGEVYCFPRSQLNFSFGRRVIYHLKGLWEHSKTSLNRTLLFQKVVRFGKISVYTKCQIAPPNRTKFGLLGGFSDVLDHSSKPSEVRINARAVERGDATKWTCKPNMKARKLQANPNIVQIAV